MGSQFINKGITLPDHIWSAWLNLEAYEIVYKTHKDYINAGAQYITTNTFRTTPRAYKKLGFSDVESEILARTSLETAVSIAKKAKLDNIKILGSIAPLEDCYMPNLFPGKNIANKEFLEISNWLYDSGIDIFLLETMNSINEATSCLDILRRYNTPVWVSFVLLDSKHILSGEPLKDVIEVVKDYDVKYLLINCNSLDRTFKALDIISSSWNSKWGIYPNLGIGDPNPDGNIKNISEDKEVIDLIDAAISLNVNIIGGCCGSTPRHIKLIKEYIQNINISI